MSNPLTNKDIRVGNYITPGNNGVFRDDHLIYPVKVLEIGNDEREFEQIYCEDEGSFEWLFKGNYFGLPLREDILLRMGFVKDEPAGPGWYVFKYVAFENSGDSVVEKYLKHTVKIHINLNSFRANISNEDEDGLGASLKGKIEYVHQLQNLIFLMTGEDVEFEIFDLYE